jgi:hypothetical protein
MSDFNPKEYRRDKFNKKKKEYKKNNYEDYSDITKKNKEFKRKKQHLKEEDDWNEYDELY